MGALPGDTIVCDAVLDQVVLPGAGNIIKMEGLHRARVAPCRTLGTLSASEVAGVIREVRTYALAWRKKGQKGPLHVYNKVSCADCARPVSMQKMGGALRNSIKRTTFWCPACCSGGGGGGGGQSSLSGAAGSAPQQAHHAQHAQHAPHAPQPGSGASLYAGPATATCSLHGRRCLALSRSRKRGPDDDARTPNFDRVFFSCRPGGARGAASSKCIFFQWADGPFPRCACKVHAPAPADPRRARPPPRDFPAVLKISKKEGTGGRWFFCCGGGDGPGRQGRGGGRFGGGGGRHGGVGERSRGGGDARPSCAFFAWAQDEQLAHLGNLLHPLL
ncbi:hypothetical protein FOA52_001047 [Chlamydomonas sp. UWO 241]|nr:hypothetical protein FOA52_001047 [Chlamydomonas sp. UWO 241]